MSICSKDSSVLKTDSGVQVVLLCRAEVSSQTALCGLKFRQKVKIIFIESLGSCQLLGW